MGHSRGTVAGGLGVLVVLVGTLLSGLTGGSVAAALPASGLPAAAAPTAAARVAVAGLGAAASFRGAVPGRPGVLRSAPATVSTPSSGPAVFVVGTDGGIWWSTDRTGWSSLGAPPPGLTGDPAAVSWGGGRIDLFVRGGDAHLWQRWSACAGCAWSQWLAPLGADGTLASSPTVTSWGPGRLDVFVLGTDGVIYQRFWDTTAWNRTWLPRGGPGPGVDSAPAAASWGPGRVDLFVRGRDLRLWRSFWNGSRWTGWFQPPGTTAGTLTSAPAATPWYGGPFDPRPHLTVLTRGTDGHVYQTRWDGSWTAWTPVGGPGDVIVGAPGVVTTLQAQPSVTARGTDDRVYRYAPPDPLGPAVAAIVAARSDNVTAAVYDITSGMSFTFRPGVVEHTASTVKVDILGTLLTQVQAAGRPLTPEEQSLAVPMIEDSLDGAANALWVRLGPAAVAGFERRAGLTRTVPPTNGIWGTTTTTALDRLAIMREVVFPGPVLTDASRGYLLGLMEHITPSQAWGVTGGVPPGVTVALKNGFSVINGWQINSMGWVNGAGRNYLIAVLTDGNPTEQYGIQTIDAISAAVFGALGP